MLLRTKSLIASLLVVAALVGCENDDLGCESSTTMPTVEPIGAPLYAVDRLKEIDPQTLYRTGDRVQLVAGPDESFEVLATLSPEAIDLIEQAESEIGSGAALGSLDPMCLTFVDLHSVTLSLGVEQSSLGFRYPWGCAPGGLAELDAAMRELVAALPTCEPTPLLSECSVTGE